MGSVSSRRLVALALRSRKKPLSVTARKAAQYGRLLAWHALRTWDRQQRQTVRHWTPRNVAKTAAELRADQRLLIGRANLDAVRQYLDEQPEQRARLRAFRDRVASRRVEVFETTVDLPPWEQVRWCADWRFGHAWPEAFFRQYNFYEFEKPVPYDVKFPWELSRLNFLMIPTLLSVLEPDATWPPTLARILSAWRRGNRCARSVNWYPMECAMRGVNLAQLVPLLVHGGREMAPALRHALVLCELHGRFLYRTVEYADVRGNHFLAEIVALILLGQLLGDHVTEARHWRAYGRRFLESEILAQFHGDGVHFETSTAYHRLVTQLLLLALIASDKAGEPVSADVRHRVLAACRYSRAYLRCDGSAPLWGDSDDARAISFDTNPARDHRGLVTLGANYFHESSLALPDHTAIEVPLLLGCEPIRPAGTSAAAAPAVRHFEQGGMVCARFGETSFIADVGAVGFQGRGGHGHLDALSFELSLNGVPLIVDPGSFNYTGDCAARNRFRATRAHNVAQVDGREMATLFPRQLWRLGTEADPFDVRLASNDDGFELAARHNGYAGLADPVGYERRWRFDAQRQSLVVSDSFEARESHLVERLFHFAPGLQFDLVQERLTITSASGERFVLHWSSQATARLVNDWVSPSYGTRVGASTLVLSDEIAGAAEMAVEIGPADVRTPALAGKLALTAGLGGPTIPSQFGLTTVR